MIKLLQILSLIFMTVSGFAEIPKEQFVSVDGAELYCRTLGKGTPIIVIHGGPGLSQNYLLPQLYRLAEKYFVIFYDQRGCGESKGDFNADTINIQTYINDLDAIIKAFKLDKAALLGHSWGGLLAMQYAIAHPQSVNQLILANTCPASSAGFNAFIEEVLTRAGPVMRELGVIEQSQEFIEGDPDTHERAYQLYFPFYCHLPESAKLVNIRMSKQANVSGRKVYGLFRDNFFSNSYDFHEQLENLKVPTLILHGDSDVVPVWTAQVIHENIPHSQFVLLKNCGHFPYVESPDAFFKHIEAFLQCRKSF